MTSNPQDPQPLSRDQLLGALDTEIASTNAILASTGRTRWALLIALSALLWAALET
jgi:hypothetical protein